MKRLYLLGMAVIVSLICVHTAKRAYADDFLKALQDSLHKLGDPWIAGETELSDLPIEEKRAMCGFVPMPEGEWKPDLEEEKRSPLKNLPPASWDWRNKDGKNWMTSVKNQKPCENCWAFTMCSQMEAMLKIQNNAPGGHPNLSEQFLTNCNTKGKSCMGGGNYSVYDDVKNFGVCDEACFPYTASDRPCSNRCTDWQDRVVKITSYRTSFYTNASDAQKKEWIMEGPIACAITVKEDFFYYKGGAYEPIMGEKLPNHAVCCIGWTSAGKWICKNSWGPYMSYPIVSVIEWPCWVKMAGTPIIWTSDSLNFVFGEKGIRSSSPYSSKEISLPSITLDKNSILLEHLSIMEPIRVEGEKSLVNSDTLGGGYVDSGIIWVKNIGQEILTVSNVNAIGASSWIATISPTNFSVYAGDSAGIEIAVDTSGLQEEVRYKDKIVIVSNSAVKTETKVPITLLIKTTGVAEEKESMLATFKLSPNPFRDKVGISYFVPKKANVKLVVCDIAGREVARIVDRVENTGIKKIEWDTKNIPSGVYFCRLTTGKSEATRKVLLIR